MGIGMENPLLPSEASDVPIRSHAVEVSIDPIRVHELRLGEEERAVAHPSQGSDPAVPACEEVISLRSQEAKLGIAPIVGTEVGYTPPGAGRWMERHPSCPGEELDLCGPGTTFPRTDQDLDLTPLFHDLGGPLVPELLQGMSESGSCRRIESVGDPRVSQIQEEAKECFLAVALPEMVENEGPIEVLPVSTRPERGDSEPLIEPLYPLFQPERT
jgi:hypothetical protein